MNFESRPKNTIVHVLETRRSGQGRWTFKLVLMETVALIGALRRNLTAD